MGRIGVSLIVMRRILPLSVLLVGLSLAAGCAGGGSPLGADRRASLTVSDLRELPATWHTDEDRARAVDEHANFLNALRDRYGVTPGAAKNEAGVSVRDLAVEALLNLRQAAASVPQVQRRRAYDAAGPWAASEERLLAYYALRVLALDPKNDAAREAASNLASDKDPLLSGEAALILEP